MLFKKFTDTLSLSDGKKDNFGTVVSKQLPNRGFWLEGMTISASVKTDGSAVSGYAPDCLFGLCRNITLTVDEGPDGKRDCVNAEGAGIAEYERQVFGNRDYDSLSWQGVTAATWFHMQHNIWFAHPELREPYKTYCALPLPRYATPPLLNVSIPTRASIANTFTADLTYPGVKLDLTLHYASVIDPTNTFPHWKSELRTTSLPWGRTGNVTLDQIAQGGLLTGFTLIDYGSGRSTGYSRTWSLADEYNDTYGIEYQGRTVFRDTPMARVHMNQLSAIPMTNAGLGVLHYDLIGDMTQTDTFALRSAWPLDATALAGGQMRITGSNIANSAAITTMTTHKLLIPQSITQQVSGV